MSTRYTPSGIRTGLVAWCALLVVLPGLLVPGCTGPATTGCPEAVLSPDALAADNISLELFRALPPGEQALRHGRAVELLDRARHTSHPERRLSFLGRAVGQDPGLAEGWLDLAELLHWVATDAKTESALDNASRAISALTADQENETALTRRLSLLRAWYHYDRGEWSKGLRWARMVYDPEPGNDAARVITGLLEARLGHTGRARSIAGDILRSDGFAFEPVWIKACLEISRGLDREAFSFMPSLHPRGNHASECWMDMARTAERLHEWSFAVRWHREAAAALPLGDTGCLGKVIHARLAPGPRASAMPVWLGMQNAYVTGSLSAYTALALEKFDRADPGPERDLWAGETVNAAGMCVRLNLDTAWARRAKGLVFAATGNNRRALQDLRRASKDLTDLGLPDGRLEAELGHLLILEEGYDEALTHLRKAVELAPDRAQTWSDLGLVMVRSGDNAGAEEALTRAIELDPGLVAAWYNRGLLNMHRGDLERAAADLAEAARLVPDNQDIARLLQQIERKRQQR